MAAALAVQVTRHRREFDLDNPVTDAIVLTAIVGVPNTIVARLAWRGDPRASFAVVTAAGLLMGWVFVEGTAFSRTSVLAPAYAAVG